MRYPDWLVVPLPANDGRILELLGSRLALVGFAVERLAPQVLRLQYKDVQLRIEHVPSPFPTHEAPAHLALSGGELFETTVLDGLEDAAWHEFQALAARGLSEPHMSAASSAMRRLRHVQGMRTVLAVLFENRLAEEVVLPLAHAHTVPLSDVVQRPQDVLGFGLVVRTAADGSYAWIDGTALFGQLEIGVPLTPKAPHRIAAAGALLSSLLPHGLRPRSGYPFEAHGETFTVERLRGSQLWLAPSGEAGEAELRARYQFAFLDAAQRALGADWWRSEAGPPVVPPGAPWRMDLLTVHAEAPLQIALTNGFGRVAQPGAATGVELFAISPRMGPRVVHAVSLLATALNDAGRTRPISAWDRIAVQGQLPGNIAAAILKPVLGEPLPVHAGREVILYDALPVFADELAAFRSDAAAHGRWLEERWKREDYAAIHARWARIFD